MTQATDHSFAGRVAQVVEPVLGAQGYELVLVEYLDKSYVLRLYIDRQAGVGQGGVTLDDCTAVTRLVSDLLDAEGLSDQVDGKYTLEVSSPGLDRPLAKPEHFVRYVGHRVKLVTNAAVGDDPARRKFAGDLVRAETSGICLDVDGTQLDIGYDKIVQARLVPQF